MHTELVHELPPFDTGQYEGCEFRMHQGAASLHIRVAELGTLTVTFSRVRWHQFTALPNCTAEMVGAAYFRLVEVASPELEAFVAADSSLAKAYSELHHYRIFLDETGCHEVFAQSFSAASQETRCAAQCVSSERFAARSGRLRRQPFVAPDLLQRASPAFTGG